MGQGWRLPPTSLKTQQWSLCPESTTQSTQVLEQTAKLSVSICGFCFCFCLGLGIFIYLFIDLLLWTHKYFLSRLCTLLEMSHFGS